MKEQAVEFQVGQFGVNGFVSSFVPEELSTEERFDLIFVGSLFTHLPEDLFGRWLKVLFGLTTGRGVLAISVHDTSLKKKRRWRKAADFAFQRGSEESYFEVVADSIKDQEVYGVTLVSEAFVRGVLRKNGIRDDQYCRYPKAFGGLQDIYVISREPNADGAHLDLTGFP